MATQIVAPPAQKPSKLPPVSPYAAPRACCPGCKEFLEPKPGKDDTGQFALIYVCETCNYASVVSPPHVNGREIATAKLGQKGFPAIVEKT